MKHLEAILLVLLFLALPAAVHAQFDFTTNNGTLTVKKYTGTGGAVTIPDTTNGLLVTSIAEMAFVQNPLLTGVTVPNSVTNIGDNAFYNCTSLAKVALGSGVNNIGWGAFAFCTHLTNLTVPSSVTKIGNEAFYNCYDLDTLYFWGNAPKFGAEVFATGTGSIWPTVYYLPGTTGWDSLQVRMMCSPVLWQASGSSLVVVTNGFGFTVTGTADIPMVIEACTDLANSAWSPQQSCTLTNGAIYFSDAQWTNYPGRFYRLRWP